MDIYEISDKIGIDLDETISNFAGNKALYTKCLKLFSSNKAFLDLEKGIKNADYSLIEFSAHALKGVASNMGFKNLFEITSKMVFSVRNYHYTMLPSLFRYAKIEYEKIISNIAKLD